MVNNMWDQLKILKHQDVIKSIYSYNSIPIHVEIEPTEICNNRCIFCHWHGKERKGNLSNFDFTGHRSLPLKRFLSLIEELKKIGTVAISFTGVGDPLMYKGIEKIFDKIINSNMEFAVTSNFNMKLSDSIIKLLKNASWLRWSANAGSKDMYQKIHNPQGGLDFLDTLANIKRLLSGKRKAKINASYVICENNQDGIIKATKIVKDLGIDSISFRPDSSFKRSVKGLEYNKDMIQTLEEAKKLKKAGFEVFANYDRLKEFKKNKEDLYCYYSNHSVYIAANGDVYPCCMTRYDKKYSFGNILDKTFKEFWNSEQRKQNYKKINNRFCPPCRHTQDNCVLKLLYGDGDKLDNFI